MYNMPIKTNTVFIKPGSFYGYFIADLTVNIVPLASYAQPAIPKNIPLFFILKFTWVAVGSCSLGSNNRMLSIYIIDIIIIIPMPHRNAKGCKFRGLSATIVKSI
jgi:hypothetical protein